MAKGQWAQSSSGGIDTDELTATADQVLKGYTAGVKGSDEPQDGNLEIQSIVNFKSALYQTGGLILSWSNPEKGPYSGVKIVYRTDRYPETPDDGEIWYEGNNNSSYKTGLSVGSTYYVRAWSYITILLNEETDRIYADHYVEVDGKVVPETVIGSKTYTSSGCFEVPEGVYTIQYHMVGGGGAGGARFQGQARQDNGGGGGGGYTTRGTLDVVPGDQLCCYVGGGGGAPNGGGGASYINRNGIRVATVNGGGAGSAGTDRNSAYGGNGGSGGGGGYFASGDSGGSGGSDGSDGKGYQDYASYYGNGGTGQHTTTKDWGTGTLRGGGGGGGTRRQNGSGGSGGSGGGGGGSYPGMGGSSGGNQYGGGGGGAGGNSNYAGPAYGGGSGIVLVKW